MRKLMMVAVVLVLAAATTSAAPLCTALLGTNVLSPGGFTCELGGLTFSGFAGTNVGSAPNPMQVNLAAASIVSDTVYLTFNPNLVATSTLAADLWFYFQVSGSVLGVDLYNGGSTGTSIQEVVCSDPFSQAGAPNVCSGTVLANMAAGPLETRDVRFAADSSIFIWKDILALPADGHISSFTQSFHVPEPMTFVLIGTGLLGLGILGRRRAQK